MVISETPSPMDRLPSAPRRHFVSIRLSVAIAVLVAVVDLPPIFVLPRFEEIFRDWDTHLSPFTLEVLKISHWIASDLGWLYLLCVAALVPIFARHCNARKSRKTESILGRISILAALAIAFLLIVAMFSPMIQGTDVLSGK